MTGPHRSGLTRRSFLGGIAAAGALGALAPGMVEALAEPRVRGRLDDVQHVVVLMQENRSFDHYYGTMKGVRGYGDRSAIVQPDGRDIFHQPDPSRTDGGYLLPFQVDTSRVDGQDLGDLGHGWSDQHQAIAGGANTMWIPAKGEMTMGYFSAGDIPFHRALADAFTLCDHYHCSVQGATTPNRLYLFTGTIDADGRNGGPANGNPANDYQPVFGWTTYPERLQQQGVTWKVYANTEHPAAGDKNPPFIGDYGDNPLWLFNAYHQDYASELSRRAGVLKDWAPDSGQGKDVHHVLAEFTADCASGSLPRVSWIVAPYGYCEHPEARPVDGAAYTQAVLNALWANPKLWESTVVFINYDENDGFFDHVPPPIAPPGTAGEYIGGKPIGLGARVPMTVISPWSRGGWISSEVTDHTSVLRFLERWTGVAEPNISAWRRAISGDLMTCFDFSATNLQIPVLPDTTAMRQQADDTQQKLPKPAPPVPGGQQAPVQETGTRPARPLPYQPSVGAAVSADHQILTTTLANEGTAAVQLMAYRTDGQTDGPWPYDLAPGAQISDTWRIQMFGGGQYGIAVHGPNRFRWVFTGDANSAGAGVEVTGSYTAQNKLRLTMHNSGTTTVGITVAASNYRADGPWSYPLAAGQTMIEDWNVIDYGSGWYDLSATLDADPRFLRRFSGHLETGTASITG
ncbi:phosphocholine-specific phospholipase C [Amycolatopsis sp. PS_44_ISF1]|uniref:phosphocholine-specific phospholipase C n=1 Tax=Amycolatopsis sp. PS_44_ISF1 TaxID=2974917 RepID=UPI0028DD687D|nr:phospholipase C, phosphocholine-specific [Amycolatopsis sp. PS_44_ISF1]MDT8913642.1 phospholipase C, phosphocholine-specific [Amycolatopsis sp. PS_44_ISF1]